MKNYFGLGHFNSKGSMYHSLNLLTIISPIVVVMCGESIIKTISSKKIIETCIVDIISSKTLHGADVSVIQSNLIGDNLIRKLQETNNVKLYIKAYNVSVNNVPNVFVVHDDNKDDFENIVRYLDSDLYRQPRALFIMALTNMRNDDLPAIFDVLLDYHMIHVLVIIEDLEKNASVYSYFPYASGMCGRNYNNSVKLGDCSIVRNLDIIEKLRKYEKPDLQNCTFNILAHDNPPLVLTDLDPTDPFSVGIETFLVQLLLEQENIHLNLTIAPEGIEFGNITDNFTITGTLENLYENEIDMLFGGYSLSYKRAVLFDYIYIHLAFEDIYVPVTPSADLEERWKIVFVVFDYKVWLLLTFTIFLCSIILSENMCIFRNKTSPELFKLFGYATQNVTLNLREKLFKNFIVIHWMWFMFLVVCYYQTRLTSYSTYMVYQKQIDEYMSLQSYNLTPCMPQDIAEFLTNYDIAPIINVQDMDTENCLTADLALDELAKSSSKYTVTLYYRYLWWAAKHLKEKSRIHVMKENVYQTHIAIFLKRGFPLLKTFEARMSRIVECGFVHAIKDLHRIPHDTRSSSSILGAFDIRPLILHDLVVPFSILGGGYVVGLVIFFIEIIYNDDERIVLHQN